MLILNLCPSIFVFMPSPGMPTNINPGGFINLIHDSFQEVELKSLFVLRSDRGLTSFQLPD